MDLRKKKELTPTYIPMFWWNTTARPPGAIASLAWVTSVSGLALDGPGRAKRGWVKGVVQGGAPWVAKLVYESSDYQELRCTIKKKYIYIYNTHHIYGSPPFKSWAKLHWMCLVPLCHWAACHLQGHASPGAPLLTVRGWKKSCTTLDGWRPIDNGINHPSTGAGFLPSTVWFIGGISTIHGIITHFKLRGHHLVGISMGFVMGFWMVNVVYPFSCPSFLWNGILMGNHWN